MPVSLRVCYLLVLVLGFGLIVGGGLTAFYVAPAFKVRGLILLGLLSVAGVVAGVLLIVKSLSKLGDSGDSTADVHLPGMDLEVNERRQDTP